MKRLRIRPRAVALAVAGFVAAVCIPFAWMTSVPGRSFSGAASRADPALRRALAHDVAELAQSIGERNVFHAAALESAARFVEARMKSAGLVPKLERYTAMSCSCANVVAEIRGTSRPTEVVVVGAHYDSCPGSPGANDNATGVAAMLALARSAVHVPARRTLRFVAFVNEEPPFFETDRMGSRVLARAWHERGDDVVAMLSLETLGCYSDERGSQSYPSPLLRLVYPSRGDFVTFVSDLGSRALLRQAVGTFRAHAHIASEGGALPAWLSGVGWSDQRSFWLEGWPAIMVTDTALFRDANYHRRTDTVEHVDFERLARVVEGLATVVADLANPAADS